MNAAPEIVVAGHICLDIIPGLGRVSDGAAGGDLFAPGSLVTCDEACLSTGGAVSNTGLGLLKLGNRVALMGKIGRDPFGGLVRDLLRDGWGVTEGMIVAEDAATSYSVILAPGRSDRMFIHFPGANETFRAADVDYDLVARARLFHFGYPPVMRHMFADGGRELAQIFRRVKELGVTTSLDMCMPDPASAGGRADWRSVLLEVLPHVDLFMPSVEETLYMLDRSRFDEMSRRARGDMAEQFTGDDLHGFGESLLAMGAGVAMIKCGAAGIYVRTAAADILAGAGKAAPRDAADWAEKEIWHPCFRVEEFASATGCGDAAIAGLLTALIKGFSLEEALRRAAACGAGCAAAPDALSLLPTWDELEEALKAGWQTEPLDVVGKGWRSEGALRFGPAHRKD